MKCISWNVNGLRACLKKGFMESFVKLDADVFALQETKMQPEQAILDLPGYRQYWNSARATRARPSSRASSRLRSRTGSASRSTTMRAV